MSVRGSKLGTKDGDLRPANEPATTEHVYTDNASSSEPKKVELKYIEEEWVHDIVLVFPNPERLNSLAWKSLSPENLKVLKEEIKKTIDVMRRAGLQVKVAESVDHDELFAKIRAPEHVLLQAARLMNGRMLLKEEFGSGPVDMKKYFNMKAANGYLDDPKLPDDFSELDLTMDPGAGEDDGFYVFRSVMRIRIIMFIMTLDKRQGGCGLDLHDLSQHHWHRPRIIKQWFVTHNQTTVKILTKRWALSPFRYQPMKAVASYLGEDAAMYFAFMGYYSTWLWLPAMLGIIMFIFQIISLQMDHEALPAFCVCITLWSTLFIQYWRRRETFYAFDWGTIGSQHEERPRPTYISDGSENVGGEALPSYTWWKHWLRVMVSAPVMGLTAMICLISGVSLLLFRNFLTLGSVLGNFGGSVLAGFCTACQIEIFQVFIMGVARKITEFQNLRTEGQFKEVLVINSFLMSAANSYITFFWIAFSRAGERANEARPDPIINSAPCQPRIPGGDPDCINQLAVHYATVMMFKFFLSKLVQVVQPVIKYQLRVLEDKKNLGKREISLTWDEQQAHREDYPDSTDDFMDVVLQFGYLTMFGVAFPLAFVMSLIANLIEVRMDAFRMLQLYKRPFPYVAENVGIWFYILNLIAVASMIVNCLMFAYTSTLFNYYDKPTRLTILIVVEHILLIAKFLIQLLVPSGMSTISRELVIQHWYADYVIFGYKDDGVDIDGSGSEDLDIDVEGLDEAEVELQDHSKDSKAVDDGDYELLLLAQRLGVDATVHPCECCKRNKWLVLLIIIAMCTLIPLISIPLTTIET